MRRDIFNAIADVTRRDILLSLIDQKQNVSTLAKKFDITRQAVSLHVKYLHECGVITIQQEGRERICNLEANKLTEIADWLKPFRQLWENRFSQLDHALENIKTNQKK